MKRSGKMNNISMWNYPGFAIPGMECVSETLVKAAAPRLESSVEYVTLWLNTAVTPVNSVLVRNYPRCYWPHGNPMKSVGNASRTE